MPLYEFECKDCGLVMEKLQSYDAPAPKCERCGCDDTKRQVSRGVGAKFNGPGFHANDYPS